jgi:hypothetical protein
MSYNIRKKLIFIQNTWCTCHYNSSPGSNFTSFGPIGLIEIEERWIPNYRARDCLALVPLVLFYEKVREASVIQSEAVQIVIGINEKGRR